MKKKSVFVVTVFLIIPRCLFAQVPDTLWSKIHSISPLGDIDEGRCVRQTNDGGYIITGSCVPEGLISHVDLLLLKTDSRGDQIWVKKYDRHYFEVGYSVEQTSDGGYIIGGRAVTGTYPIVDTPISDAWILKTDANGDTLWTKIYGGSGNDYCTSIQQTPDRGYILTGTMNAEYCYPNLEINEEDDPDFAKAWLVKTDACGDTLWTKTYLERSYSNCVDQVSDGGYVFAGWVFPDGKDDSDVLIIKTDASGDTLWTKTIGGDDYDAGFHVRQTGDGYIIVGQTKPRGEDYDALLIKTDLSGELLWSKTFGGALSDAGFTVEVFDAGYFITGTTNGTWWLTAMADMWVFATDFDGNLLWEKIYDIRFAEMAFSGVLTIDGGYVISGTTSHGFGGDLWLAKLGQESSRVDNHASGISGYVLHQNYPNPFNAETTISFELDQSSSVTLKIYDIVGTEVLTILDDIHYRAGSHSVHLNGNRMASGVYFYRLMSDGGFTQMKKMCVLN